MANNTDLTLRNNHLLRLVACLITCFACGLIDGYTLIFKGYFSMLQTGNLIFLVSYSAQGQFHYLFIYIPVIVSFMIALFVSEVINDKLKNKHNLPIVLNALTILMLLIIIFVPVTFDIINFKIDHHRTDMFNIISNSIFAMIGAFLYKSCVQLDTAYFTSTLMTANLSRLSTSFFKGVIKKEKSERTKFIDYILIISCFSLGVAIYSVYHRFYILENFNNQSSQSIMPNLILFIPVFLLSIIVIIDYLIVQLYKNKNLI